MTHWLISYATGLISMMNPLGNAGLLAGMTSGVDSRTTRAIVAKCMAAVFTVLMLSTWLGASLLNAAGIDVHELRTAGGIIVFIIGMKMLFNDTSHAQTKDEADSVKDVDSIAVVPLAIPIVAGPGTISFVIATAAAHDSNADRMLMSGVGVVLVVVCGLMFAAANPIADSLGKNGMAVVTRIVGMVLASSAIGMVASGIRGLFPELFT